MFHNTAIKRNKPSRPAIWLARQGLLQGRVLDYGCGRGFDADYYRMEKYDSCSFPKRPEGQFDIILCSYVLNVVDNKTEVVIINDIRRLLKPGGTAFFAVRRDKDCLKHQRWITLDMELLYEGKGTFAIYKIRGEIDNIPIPR